MAELWLNDIALVKIREEIPHTADLIPHIQSVPLAQDNDFPPDGTTCIMKGWGCSEGGNFLVA